jgi:molecular chaperone DnaK
VLATGGDTFLGGMDIDNRLAELVVKRFQKEHQIDLGKDPISHQRIRDACEQAKIELSNRPEVRISIPFITMSPSGPLNIDLTVKREEFEQLCGDLVEKTMVTCRQVMQDAKLKPEDLDAVLLVGGTTRIPLVAKKVADCFGKPPSKGIHPDEAVALGAAIMADSLARKGGDEIQLLDVLPMTIGIQAASGKMVPIFPRNSPYPNQKQKVFTTSKDNQASLKLTILQGDNPSAQENEIIGDFTFSGIHPAPQGQAKAEITFTLNHEGILTVSARDPDTGAARESVLQVQSGTAKPLHLDLITLKKPVEKRAGETVIAATATREKKLKAGTAPPTPPQGAKPPDPTPPPTKPKDISKPPLPPKPVWKPMRESPVLMLFRRLTRLFKRG